MYRQKCFQKQMCSAPHIHYICKMKSIKQKILWGFLTCKYDKWWLACVLHMNESKVQLTFFYPSGYSNLSNYPSLSNILCVPPSNWIQKLQGITRVISKKESCCITKKLETTFCRLWVATLTGKITCSYKKNTSLINSVMSQHEIP